MTLRYLTAAVMAGIAMFTCRVVASTPEATAAPADSTTIAVATVMGAGVEEVLDNLDAAGLKLDRAQIGQYIARYLAGEKFGFTRQEASRYINSLVSTAYPGVSDSVSVESQQAFLQSAATADGAILLPSGVVFTVITEGEGATPTIKDRVNVRYKAALSDGTVFDDTGAQAITFDVAGVIPGFAEGLMLMHPGGTYRVVIPSAAGYGPEGIPGIIPGNAALDFTVTLDAIETPQQ